ncbi:MAG: hypothetical protein N2691_03045 [Patescibacteria group bacterium]|nr:hypothetical protein [Patescibacteria group bacterium]
MKYHYSFTTYGPTNRPKSLGILLEDRIKNISGLFYEIRSEYLKIWYLEGIDAVLSGKSEEEVREGEGYGVRIRKDTSYVYFIFDESINCTIETSELRELIEIWWKEYVEFNKDRADVILLSPRGLVWKVVYAQMGEESMRMGEGHKLDPDKYKELNQRLLNDPIVSHLEKEMKKDREDGTYPQYEKYERLLFELKKKYSLT